LLLRQRRDDRRLRLPRGEGAGPRRPRARLGRVLALRFRRRARMSRDLRLRQKKSLGQVFLRTEWPCQRMVERLTEMRVGRVVEIGPGAGILTRGLLGAGLHVTAVEKDDRFASRLAEHAEVLEAGRPGKLTVVNEDFLRFDLEAWLGEGRSRAAVVGNIPYNIS